MEIYCSEHVTFVKKLVPSVEAINPPVLLTTFKSCCTSESSIPEYSNIPPNVIATMTSDTVNIMESRPPLFNSSFTISLFVSSTYPLCNTFTVEVIESTCTMISIKNPKTTPKLKTATAGSLKITNNNTATSTSNNQCEIINSFCKTVIT